MSCKCEEHGDGERCECGHGGCDCGCNCGGHAGFMRRFATREEQIDELECYLEELKKEVQAVEEHLSDLKK